MNAYLTTEQVAERLCCTKRTLERYRESGGGPRFLKFGKKVLYPVESLSVWEKERTFSSTAEADRIEK